MSSTKSNHFQVFFAVLLLSSVTLSEPCVAQDPFVRTTVGLGVDNDSHLRGEISRVFSASDRSTWIGEAWFGHDVGGIKLNHHWAPEGDDPSAEPHVRKIFGAWDRNSFGDQKLTFGGGLETEIGFLGAYGALGITGRRELGTVSSNTVSVISGADPILGPYRQEVTTTTTTRIFEQAYDFGVGVRAGRFFPSTMTQLSFGVDHERGKASSHQTTMSVFLEKYFANSPHSFAINLASIDRRGDFENIRHDHRAGIFWRYAFGSSGKTTSSEPFSRAAPSLATTLSVKAEIADTKFQSEQVDLLAAPNTQEFEVTFSLGKADLQQNARVALDEVAQLAKIANSPYTLLISGHTCDLGKVGFNQELSEKRAKTVMNYLVGAGIPAEHITVVGKGEIAPKHPNTQTDRHKNRRCEIILKVAPKSPEPPESKPEKRRDEAELNVARKSENRQKWLSRALLNTVRHKQEVDVYRTHESITTSSTGSRVYLNTPPQAINDVSVWFGSRMPAIIDALANDTDPDNDLLTITTVTNGAHGDVTIRPDGKIQYVVHKGWEGIDRFTYAISDGKGGTSTAMVTIMIIDP